MKIFAHIIILFSIFSACVTSNEKPNHDATIKNTETKTAKEFFEYDQIDHYFIDFNDKDLLELIEKKPLSPLDSLKNITIIGEAPQNIKDTFFVDKLKKIGYTKRTLSKVKHSEVDNIFREKQVNEIIATSCVYIYRDILIFKRNNKNVGIAKICFDCMANKIVGTNANTESFGQNGDYEKLKQLLQN
ncbi:hypothetical protein WG954_18900 [Lacibacter sp. H375]|uniref:hypothetical protein n=1 Tax=Lacibacter sp. H375 TaxID=3133424 RepID=UPI0030BB4C38